MTLLPGDIVATGTPEGVGPIEEGDCVRIKIDKIGEFTVDVKLAGEV
jgi:2-keto-4-pentenoate hydratase/2-oxohepta-3-ene-1,7-dioic acid hydratase in catechol pathway